jgi:hypothetical protein
MKSMIRNIPAITTMMHATPPGGGLTVFGLPRAGLNFPGLNFAGFNLDTAAMVASGAACRPCHNRKR